MASPKPVPCTFSDEFLQAARRIVRQRTRAIPLFMIGKSDKRSGHFGAHLELFDRRRMARRFHLR